MNESQATQISEKIAAGRCTITIHKGREAKDIAVRLTGLDQRDARQIGNEIADALCGEYREDAGFCAVWYDPKTKDIDAARARRSAEIDARIEWLRATA